MWCQSWPLFQGHVLYIHFASVILCLCRENHEVKRGPGRPKSPGSDKKHIDAVMTSLLNKASFIRRFHPLLDWQIQHQGKDLNVNSVLHAMSSFVYRFRSDACQIRKSLCKIRLGFVKTRSWNYHCMFYSCGTQILQSGCPAAFISRRHVLVRWTDKPENNLGRKVNLLTGRVGDKEGR